jgi:hypothetical protein
VNEIIEERGKKALLKKPWGNYFSSYCSLI